MGGHWGIGGSAWVLAPLPRTVPQGVPLLGWVNSRGGVLFSNNNSKQLQRKNQRYTIGQKQRGKARSEIFRTDTPQKFTPPFSHNMTSTRAFSRVALKLAPFPNAEQLGASGPFIDLNSKDVSPANEPQ